MSKIRKARCENFGECELADNFEIQTFEEGEELKCHKCGQPIKEKEKKGSGYTKIIVSAIAAIIIIIGLIIALSKCSGGSSNDPEPVVDSIATDSIQEVELIPINVDSIAQAKADSIIAAKAITDSIQAKALADSIKLAQADSIIAASKAPKTTKTTKRAGASQQASQASNGKLRLSYGSYTGDIKGGYPDGMGRLTYSTSRRINRYDSKGRTASAGDYVIGEFVRGFFVQGKHYDSNGTLIETLMIGTPANNQYESK